MGYGIRYAACFQIKRDKHYERTRAVQPHVAAVARPCPNRMVLGPRHFCTTTQHGTAVHGTVLCALC